MLSFAATTLFAIAGIAATLVLIDGFIRGKARYMELQQLIAQDSHQRTVTVQINGSRRPKAYSRPTAVTKVICSPALGIRPPLGAAA